MKKLSLLACLLTVSAGMAFAQVTANVPFFSDGSGNQAFIGLQNTGASSIVVTASYLNVSGAGAASGGTFTLAPNQSVSYRPFTVSGAEVQAAGLLDAPYAFGSARFTAPGGSNLQGRYVQIGASGAFAHGILAQ